jgi:hypothetical protein
MTVPVASVADASQAKERCLNPDEIIARNFEVTIPGLGCRIAMGGGRATLWRQS